MNVAASATHPIALVAAPRDGFRMKRSEHGRETSA